MMREKKTKRENWNKDNEKALLVTFFSVNEGEYFGMIRGKIDLL